MSRLQTSRLAFLRLPSRRAVIAAALSLSLTVPAFAQKKYDAGASDTEIKIGQTMPYSGPASAYGTIGKAEAAYFKMVNDNGGINGRKINFLSYDDAYNPPKAVEQIRKLVESDEVLFVFQTLGTPSNAAMQKYLNSKKVPQLFASTGATRFSDFKEFPWTMAFNPNYQSEGHVYAKYIMASYPNAKIGVLYQNDDLGKDYLKGLKDALGSKASMIIAEVPYEVTEPTIDSQMVKLKASGADLLYNVTTPKFAAQSIKKAFEMGWKPTHILNINSTSVSQVFKPAGLDASKDIISVTYGKDPSDPQWKDDDGMKKYYTFMDKYYPEGEKYSTFNSYGYSAAQVMEKVLRLAGDDLTRDNIMKIATNLKGLTNDLSLPGMSMNTTPTDYRSNKQFQLMKFSGERWDLFGSIVTDDFAPTN